MSDGFGKKNNAPVTHRERSYHHSTNAPSPRFSPTMKFAGTTFMALTSVAVVGIGLWLIMTDRMPTFMVMSGVFFYSMCLILIGKIVK